jgi:CDP-paratose 2-epimerase
MKILIAGGCGFIGSNLAIFLKKSHPQWELVCFDNLKRRGSELNLQRILSNQCIFIHGDIRNPEDLTEIQNIDLIIDAAAEPSVVAGLDGGHEQLININLNGSINLMNFAIKQHSKFIFLSTSRIYPIEPLNQLHFEELPTRFDLIDQHITGASREGISENFELKGYRSLYGSTKLSVEYLLYEYQQFYSLPFIINRMGVIAGPHQMGKVDQGVSVLWMAAHYWKKPLGYFGYGGLGKQVRDILHIEDLCTLVETQVSNFEHFEGEVFNVGGGKDNSVSLLEMSQICSKITGNTISINSIYEDRIADIRIFITDSRKIKVHSLWSPRFTPEQIFESIFEWMRSNENELKKIL